MTDSAPRPCANEEALPTPAPSRIRRLSKPVVLLVAVMFGSAARIHTTLTDPNFDGRSARSLLRSDPALLYYITERIIEGGGLPPEDFRADPRVEYPEVSDLPAMFSVCQEFLLAWCYLLAGGDVPLHVLCVWVMGVFASLTVVGVYGLALELTRSTRWAMLAAAIWLILEANYRTIGFILIREDFSIPCFAAHLYLAARAMRTRGWIDIAAAAAALVLAASSWHAMRFIVAIEVLCVLAWFVRTGQNPLRARWAWSIPLIVAVASALIPVLRSRAFFVSLPMQMMLAMLLAAQLDRRREHSSVRVRLIAIAALGITAGASLALSMVSGEGQGDYSHVFALLKAKLLHLGALPSDPSVLPFEARLLWDGPFETATVGYLLGGLGVTILMPLIAAGSAIRGWATGRGDGRLMVLMAFTVAATISSYMVSRTVVLLGLIVPVVFVIMMRKLRPRPLRTILVACAVLLQLFIFGSWLSRYRIPWYAHAERNAVLATLIDWIEENIPKGEPIAADFVTSTAILAHTRHPAILQPKYETARSRRRIEEFLTTFNHGTTAEFRELIERYKCRYLVIDPYYVWGRFQYVVGIPPAQQGRPLPRTAAQRFCSPHPSVFGNIQGFRLLYRSAPDPKRRPALYRVYELE